MKTTVATRGTSPRPEWFASWFDSTHYHTLYAHRNAAEAAELIDRLVERLRPAARDAILDLGCGSGRHATYLASKGFDVTGLDLSSASITIARQNERPNLRFRRQDMRQPFGTGRFDHIFSLFTSFGYFDDPAEHLVVLHNIARALKADGSLVLDYLNVRPAEACLTPEEVIERGGVRYRLSRWTNARYFFKRIAIDDPRAAVPLEFVERVAKFTLEDFRFMLALCDMRIDETCGDYRLAPFDAQTSPRLILVARKN